MAIVHDMKKKRKPSFFQKAGRVLLLISISAALILIYCTIGAIGGKNAPAFFVPGEAIAYGLRTRFGTPAAVIAAVLIVIVPLLLRKALQWISRSLHKDTANEPKFGDEGEQAALKLLRQLPDSYHIFVNLEYELRGHHETDLITVGPTGVTVCEVKYWSGVVRCLDKDSVRRVKKDGSMETAHSPVHQVTAHYETLRDALYRKGVRVNTGGLVLMMHKDCAVSDFPEKPVPVLVCPSIRDVRRCLNAGRLSEQEVLKTVSALEELAV